MCICSFDIRFTYVYAGWKDSANDCHIFEHARRDPALKFSHPPEDSGYASQVGYLIPFRGERYHIPDYQGAGRNPKTAKEFFNYRHSSFRNVIERTFGVLKNRFKILRHMSSFDIRFQPYIVIACCGLHNYIRDKQTADKASAELSDDDKVVIDELNSVHEPYETSMSTLNQRDSARMMNDLRKNIANELASSRMAEI
ncbi:putative nuclease HARBI1 [Telopea speciosissima]|uniref:putative nuclease HARBI1 n=1 Tax=Telopea speciosissima TaxID=54955 RepID=UPI001CC43E8C|nr:putative nuclease HARBI1 [Telopea speciosissima]